MVFVIDEIEYDLWFAPDPMHLFWRVRLALVKNWQSFINYKFLIFYGLKSIKLKYVKLLSNPFLICLFKIVRLRINNILIVRRQPD